MEQTITARIIEFLEYCSQNKVIFAHGKAAIRQIRLHWQICYKVKLSARDAIEAQGVMWQINKQLFATRYTNTSDIIEGFVHFCVFNKYKFQGDSDEYERLFQKLWKCYFCENIEIGKVVFWMRNLPSKKGLFVEISDVEDEEILRAAHFCAENNIYINSSIPLEKILKSFWLTHFKKNIRVGNKHFLKDSMYVQKGSVDLLMLRMHVKAIAKDLNKKLENILNYCENNLLVITNDEKGILLIKTIWWEIFQQNLSEETALIYLKRAFSRYKYWTNALKQNFDFISYSKANDLMYKRGEQGLTHFKEAWQGYSGRSTNESHAKRLLRTIRTLIPELMETSSYQSNNKIDYNKFIQYCVKESIVIPVGKTGYMKVQKIWEKIHSDKISINQAKERLKCIRQLEPSLVTTQVPQKKKVLCNDLDSLPKIERQELLIIFAEYCKKNQYVFNETEDDMNKIEQIWNKCFEIR